MRNASRPSDRQVNFVNEKPIHWHRLLAQQHSVPERQSASLGNLFCFPNQFRNDLRPNFVGTVAYIKGEVHHAGNHVCRSRFSLDLADGSYRPRDSFCRVLYRTDPLCGGRHCVIAKMHRSRPRMVGAANKCELDPALSGDGLDNSDGRPSSSKTGPCSMWNSMYPRVSASIQAREISSGFSLNSWIALRTDIPCSS